MNGVLGRMTNPYSAAESWIYDFFIAPAVASFHDGFGADLLSMVPEGGHVLDVGCGGGHLLVSIAERRPDLHVTGIDLSPEQVERARERVRPFGDRVVVDVGNVLGLPYRTDAFDAVVSIASIKHWPDPRRGLEECTRVLRPGGRLHVIEADRGCRYEDAAAFVARTRLPAVLRPVFLAVFRTWVAGQSFDVEELLGFARGLPLEDVSVARVQGTPGIALDARRRHSSTP